MIAKNNPASERELEVLSLIVEEAAEVIQVISKIDRFGFDSFHPRDEQKIPNRKHLESELGDLMCLLTIAIDQKIVSEESIIVAAQSKLERLKQYSNIFESETVNFSVSDKVILDLTEELDQTKNFINDAFTAHPNLDKDVENVRKML